MTSNADPTVYHGSVPCEGRTKKKTACVNQAYYRLVDDGAHMCGVHSRKRKREALPKDPLEKQKRYKMYAERSRVVEAEAAARHARGERGDVIVTGLRMLKPPEHHDGYFKVFPNFKHDNRADGYGCASLSPKSLGPIDHGMPGLPAALNLENYHQAAKFYASEVDAEGRIKASALALRRRLYLDAVPHRHKFADMAAAGPMLFSMYYDREGKERRYSYLECRYFYCHWYERLAPRMGEFAELRHSRDEGYNLQIVGYDGYPVTRDLYEHYLDTSRPFGHELVLYTMLVVADPAEYPWNRFYRKHRDLYKNVI